MKRLFFILGLAASLGLASNLHAATFVVTNTADSGLGSLRNTLAAAGAGSTITFAVNLSGATITLASTLAINASQTIDASALANGIQINGNGACTIFNVASGAIVILKSLTITNGYTTSGSGAGIINNGTLTLDQCTVLGNIGYSYAGGGIENGGTLMLNQCNLSDNSDAFGGAIDNRGTATLNGCSLSGNDGTSGAGGGIENGGTVTLTECTLSDNSADNYGGGVDNSGTAILNQCTLSGNSAFASGEGGGIYNDNAGKVTLNQCTLSRGIASIDGGGIANNGTATLNECTLSGNIASGGSGGGIANQGAATLTECTVSGNSAYLFSANYYGGGVVNGGTMALTNSIVAGNSGSSGADIYLVATNLTYGGSNLVQFVYNSGGKIIGPPPTTNAPDLASLGNYGGPAPTMPPLPGSPAIGAGSLAANTFTNDQRGYPRTQHGLIDIGAVELPVVAPFTASPTNDWQPNPVQFTGPGMDSDGSAIVQWNWSFGDNQTGAGQNPSHVYITTGVLSPGLIVTDSLGLTLAASGPAITVYPPLTLTHITLSKTNLTLAGINGVSGSKFSVLTSTNLALPLSRWTSLATNTWSANGAFSLTLTNALNPPIPSRFYLLRVP